MADLVRGQKVRITQVYEGTVDATHNGVAILVLNDGTKGYHVAYEDTYRTGSCSYTVERLGPVKCPTCERDFPNEFIAETVEKFDA